MVARDDSLRSPAATRGLIARYLTLDDHAPQAPLGLLDALTEREREVVALVATGMSNAEIADHLTLSPLTVKTHANLAMTKLGARDRALLVFLAYQAGPAVAAPAVAFGADGATQPFGTRDFIPNGCRLRVTRDMTAPSWYTRAGG